MTFEAKEKENSKILLKKKNGLDNENLKNCVFNAR